MIFATTVKPRSAADIREGLLSRLFLVGLFSSIQAYNHGNIRGVLRNVSICQQLLRIRLTSNIINNAPHVICGGTDNGNTCRVV